MNNQIIRFLVSCTFFFSPIILSGIPPIILSGMLNKYHRAHEERPWSFKLSNGKSITIRWGGIKIEPYQEFVYPVGLNQIKGVSELRNRNLLISTSRRIAIFNPSTKEVTSDCPFNTDIHIILEPNDGRLIVYSSPFYRNRSENFLHIFDYAKENPEELKLVMSIEKKLGFNTLMCGMDEIEKNKIITWCQTGTFYLWNLEDQTVKTFFNESPDSLRFKYSQEIIVRKLSNGLIASWYCNDPSEISIWDFTANDALITIFTDVREEIATLNDKEFSKYLFGHEDIGKIDKKLSSIVLKLKLYMKKNNFTDIKVIDLINALERMPQEDLQQSIEYLYFKIFMNTNIYNS